MSEEIEVVKRNLTDTVYRNKSQAF